MMNWTKIRIAPSTKRTTCPKVLSVPKSKAAPMIGTMSDNVTNFEAVDALPDFPLFPWFFVIPGVLLVGLALVAGTGLTPDEDDDRPSSTRSST